MRLELEELEGRLSPSGLDLSGTIAQQAAQVQAFVTQELNTILGQVTAPTSPYQAALQVYELNQVFQVIEPAILSFVQNGTVAFGGSPTDIGGFAASLGQVAAALSLFSHP